jgi:hypothetical protein
VLYCALSSLLCIDTPQQHTAIQDFLNIFSNVFVMGSYVDSLFVRDLNIILIHHTCACEKKNNIKFFSQCSRIV